MTFREFLARDLSRNRLEYDFLNPSIYVPFSDSLRKFFWMAHPASDEDVFEYVQRVVGFVCGQFEYEPGLTRSILPPTKSSRSVAAYARTSRI